MEWWPFWCFDDDDGGTPLNSPGGAALLAQ